MLADIRFSLDTWSELHEKIYKNKKILVVYPKLFGVLSVGLLEQLVRSQFVGKMVELFQSDLSMLSYDIFNGIPSWGFQWLRNSLLNASIDDVSKILKKEINEKFRDRNFSVYMERVHGQSINDIHKIVDGMVRDNMIGLTSIFQFTIYGCTSLIQVGGLLCLTSSVLGISFATGAMIYASIFAGILLSVYLLLRLEAALDKEREDDKAMEKAIESDKVQRRFEAYTDANEQGEYNIKKVRGGLDITEEIKDKYKIQMILSACVVIAMKMLRVSVSSSQLSEIITHVRDIARSINEVGRGGLKLKDVKKNDEKYELFKSREESYTEKMRDIISEPLEGKEDYVICGELTSLRNMQGKDGEVDKKTKGKKQRGVEDQKEIEHSLFRSDGVSIAIKRGEIVVVTGKKEVGKSTLMSFFSRCNTRFQCNGKFYIEPNSFILSHCVPNREIDINEYIKKCILRGGGDINNIEREERKALAIISGVTEDEFTRRINNGETEGLIVKGLFVRNKMGIPQESDTTTVISKKFVFKENLSNEMQHMFNLFIAVLTKPKLILVPEGTQRGIDYHVFKYLTKECGSTVVVRGCNNLEGLQRDGCTELNLNVYASHARKLTRSASFVGCASPLPQAGEGSFGFA